MRAVVLALLMALPAGAQDGTILEESVECRRPGRPGSIVLVPGAHYSAATVEAIGLRLRRESTERARLEAENASLRESARAPGVSPGVVLAVAVVSLLVGGAGALILTQ